MLDLPDELEGDSRSELHVRHVLGGLLVAAVGAGGPGTTRPQVRDARGLDASSERIAAVDLVFMDTRQCKEEVLRLVGIVLGGGRGLSGSL